MTNLNNAQNPKGNLASEFLAEVEVRASAFGMDVQAELVEIFDDARYASFMESFEVMGQAEVFAIKPSAHVTD
jgi:hypothetical protein